MTRGFRSVEELRKNLASLGSAPLPEIWEKRLLEFSKATGHKAYSVPKEYHAITQLFGNLFKTENKEPGTVEQMRTQLAERGAALAARFLPAGAYLNGKPLPHDHRPKGILPVIESNPTSDSTVPPLIAPKKARTISESKKRAPRKAAVLTAVQPTI